MTAWLSIVKLWVASWFGWDAFWQTLSGMFTSCILAGCVVGCSQIERERQSVVDESKAVFMKIVDKAKLDQSNLNANGKVINPEYQYTWFGGTGIYSVGTIRAIGVEVNASAMGSGTGETSVVDEGIRKIVADILQRRDISELERKKLIADTIAEWFEKLNETAATQPAEASQ